MWTMNYYLLLESIEGVASVTATGVLDTDLQVTMNQEKIDALNEQILSKIDAQFTDAQAELDKASSRSTVGKRSFPIVKKRWEASLEQVKMRSLIIKSNCLTPKQI